MIHLGFYVGTQTRLLMEFQRVHACGLKGTNCSPLWQSFSRNSGTKSTRPGILFIESALTPVVGIKHRPKNTFYRENFPKK